MRLLGMMLVLLPVGCGSQPNTQPISQPRQAAMDKAANGAFYPYRDARFAREVQPSVALQDNACALLAARPHWREALQELKRNWQIEPWYVLAFMYQESRFNPTALSKSQAYGLAQVKAPTWEWYELKRGRINTSRERFDDTTDFMGWYAHQNRVRNGIDLNDVRNQYLAYHEGLGGYEQASFIGKPWLLTVTDKVVDRAMMYQAQLFTCPL